MLSLSRPGTYVLTLHLPAAQAIQVGRLGKVRLPAGFYAYIGSALGSGGLRGRLNHHLQATARPRWHIDYLRRVARLKQIWVVEQPVRREHDWAQLLCQWARTVPAMPGLGSSDCRCETHLFRWLQQPSIAAFQRLIYNHFPEDAPVRAIELRLLGSLVRTGAPY